MSTKQNDKRAQQAEKVEKLCARLALPPPVVINVKPVISSSKSQKPTLSFVLGSTQKVSQSLQGHTTGVLIFGSATRPGGGWRAGAKAQEEDVSLSSSWGVQAEQAPEGFYKEEKGWGADAILNAKGLWLFDEYGYELEKPKACSFVSIACPNRLVPFVGKTPYSELVDKLTPRIVTALNTWEDQKLDHVVLGALGCGVFKWDPIYSAQAFKKAIPLSKYTGHIHFAFIDPTIKEVFEQELSSLVRKMTPNIKRK